MAKKKTPTMSYYCHTCKEVLDESDVNFEADEPRHPVEGEVVDGSWKQRWHDVMKVLTTRLIEQSLSWYEDGIWSCEECDMEWTFEADGPEENEMKFCPQCGRMITDYVHHADEPEICPRCDGSGEGMHEGSGPCTRCHGKGVLETEKERAAREDEEDHAESVREEMREESKLREKESI